METDRLHIKWDDQSQTTLWCILKNNWNWNDLAAAIDSASKTVEGMPHNIDLIIDMQGTVKIAPNAMSQLLTLAKRHPGNLRTIVFVTESTTFASLFSVIGRISRRAKAFYRLALNQSDALQITQKDRNGSGTGV
ncbi:MAG: hypothetical protein AAF787_06825 [Chloroflexota bacterium]